MATTRSPYSMTRGAARVLSNILQLPNTHTKVADIHRAGRIAVQLEDILSNSEAPKPENPQAPTAQEIEDIKAWQAEEETIEMTEKERDLCRSTFKAVVGKGNISAGKQVNQLIEALGLGEEE